MEDINETDMFNLLLATVLQDKRISGDEYKLLAHILCNLEKYTIMLDTALGDGLITAEERADLFTFRMNLIRSSFRVANKDYSISHEEKELLSSLQSIIMALQKKEEILWKEFED